MPDVRDPSGRFLPGLDWHPVSSSNVKEAAYSADKKELWVLLNGGTYVYEDVPEGELESLISADSPGAYLNSNIKAVYAYRRA